MLCDDSKRRETLLWAYLSDPMPTRGPRGLLKQKSVVDALAIAAGRPIDRYVVDSGGEQTAAGKSVRLARAIAEAPVGDITVTLLVASAACLARSRTLRFEVFADLLGAGLTVEDLSGSLHPTTMTVTLAKAAARRRAVRRSLHALAGDRDA